MKKKAVITTLGVVLGLAAPLSAAPSQSELMKQAKIGKKQAEKIALRQVPNGRFASEELEQEKGKLVWSFDIAKSGTKNIIEVQVDAVTGKIVSSKLETPVDQAAEAKADKARN
jgi:uncharacterized membrane protein YkoI